MPDQLTREKWDKMAPTFDLMGGAASERRWGPVKDAFFANMKEDARILFMALGTGQDIQFFPAQRNIQAIDISPAMLEQAQARIASYDGQLDVEVMDVHEMSFSENEFDQVFTSCTFCSVPNPIEGLKQLKKVLKPDGELLMFEHTGSRYFPFRYMMDAMTQLTSRLGPDMNRKTVENVRAAGFKVTEVEHIFMDVVKTIRAIPQ